MSCSEIRDKLGVLVGMFFGFLVEVLGWTVVLFIETVVNVEGVRFCGGETKLFLGYVKFE